MAKDTAKEPEDQEYDLPEDAEGVDDIPFDDIDGPVDDAWAEAVRSGDLPEWTDEEAEELGLIMTDEEVAKWS